jgi:phage N-6-adenine-methyltransferase
MMNDVFYSSNTCNWSTPNNLFLELDNTFHFTTDVCAEPSNSKCAHFYSPEINGLNQKWTGTCFMNPPYGREISLWIKKAYESSLSGTTVVCLIPARTDTKWWHKYVMKGEIHFIEGRLKFGNAWNNAPFPSVIVVFRPPSEKEISRFATYKSNI